MYRMVIHNRRSVHVSWLSCTLPPLFPAFPSVSALSSGEVCIFPGYRAHFPLLFPSFSPFPPEKCACFRSSCTLPPLFPAFPLVFSLSSGEVCMFPGYRAHFPPQLSLPFPPFPPEKCACFRAIVHTSPTFPSFPLCFRPFLRRSVHVSWLSCTLPPLFPAFPFVFALSSGEVCMFPGLRAHFPPQGFPLILAELFR